MKNSCNNTKCPTCGDLIINSKEIGYHCEHCGFNLNPEDEGERNSEPMEDSTYKAIRDILI